MHGLTEGYNAPALQQTRRGAADCHFNMTLAAPLLFFYSLLWLWQLRLPGTVRYAVKITFLVLVTPVHTRDFAARIS